jgi:hypothetical protein
LGVPCSLSAQAWLFPSGEGAVSLSYQNIYVKDHLFSKGEAIDRGHIFSDALIMDVDYSLTDKLAVRISLPYIAAKYSGPYPHQLPIDGGKYHQAFQDFTIDVRYNISKRQLVLTPFFRVVIPSHSYEYFGHSAIGRDQHEYHVGTNLGRRLAPVFPKAFVQARYSYAFVERIWGIAPNRSNAEFQLGYFLKPRFSLLGVGQWAHTHRGVDLPFGVPLAGLSAAEYRHHDQIAKSSLLDVGGGLAYAINPFWEMFVSVTRSVEGRNGHFHAAVVTIGISRTFNTRLSAEGAGFVDSAPEPNKAFVCTCPRSK